MNAENKTVEGTENPRNQRKSRVGVVVSDRGKVILQGWQVRIEKMSESEPLDEASLQVKTLSKPECAKGSGTSRDETCLRTRWQLV